MKNGFGLMLLNLLWNRLIIKNFKMEENYPSKLNKRQLIFLDWVFDVFIYTIVLNLFAQYSEDIYFETFTISLLTAIVLKAIMFVIIGLEHRVTKYFNKKEGQIFKVLNVIIVFLILFLSKFVILEIIDIVFREKVEIYGFIPLVAMIITMIVVRKGIERIYKGL